MLTSWPVARPDLHRTRVGHISLENRRRWQLLSATDLLHLDWHQLQSLLVGNGFVGVGTVGGVVTGEFVELAPFLSDPAFVWNS